ncbi:MAG: hypothetical protein O6948_12075 [Deltaproteobacteria bacterium]|nr:hypothetical protein [Deltaproteobacteria bacterium]
MTEVNPVPRTYVRGFGALPLQAGRNIHPRTYARGVKWYEVKAALWRGLMLIREYFTSGIISDRG